jgi:hypothetical protein
VPASTQGIQAWDRYTYVNNNPLSSIDSSGHCIDGITTIPCLIALIAITGFAGGAAIYEFNISGNSWWESPEDALATAQAGVEGALISVGAALTAGQAALLLPDAAMYLGSRTNNVTAYEWGAFQNSYLTGSNTPIGIPGKTDTTADPIQNLFDDPWQLDGKSPDDIQVITEWAENNGWQVENLSQGSHKGEGFILRQYDTEGNKTGRMIQWHPGGGHHGPFPYWKFSSPEHGTIRIGTQFRPN